MNSTINTENIFGKDGFVWWLGVVEDRKEDPDRLGRVRVRIMGYHTGDKEILPTEELPWAVTMQPTTSAAVSGIGTSPTNLVEGSWVIGFFLDSKEKQQPIVIGTIGGFTQKVPFCGQESTYETVVVEGALLTQDGTIVTDSSGAPVIAAPSARPLSEEVTATEGDITTTPTGPASSTAGPAVRTDLPPLTRDQIQALMDALGTRESGNNYQADNGRGYIGRYQFGTAALEDQGILRRGSFAADGERGVYNPANWTNPAVPSITAFQNNAALQEQVMFNNLQSNYNNLRGDTGRTPVISPSTDSPERVGGLLAAAHIGGAGNARRLALTGATASDANGTSTRNYYDLGFTAVGAAGRPGGTALAVAASRSGIPATLPRASAVPGGNIRASYSSTEATIFRAGIPSAVGGFSDWSTLNAILFSETEAFQDPNREFPRCNYVDKPDTNKLATGDIGDGDTIVSRKEDLRAPVTPTARGGPSWQEPVPAYNAEYPYNQVFETEGGHVVEFDNTPTHERIHIYHKSGTYIEVDVDGTTVKKVMGDNYEVLERNNNVYVRGRYNVTVDGPARIFVKNDAHVQVWGDLNTDVCGDYNLTVGGDYNLKTGGVVHTYAGGELMARAGGPIGFRASGDFGIVASQARLGPFSSRPGSVSSISPGSVSCGELQAHSDDIPRDIPPEEIPEFEQLEVEDFFTITAATGEIPLTVAVAEESIYGIVTPTFEDVAAGTGEILGGRFAAFVDPGVRVPATEFPVTDLISITEFPPGIRLSQNFTLRDLMPDLTSRSAAAGITPQAALVNLRNLAANSLDSIANRFPDLRIITGDIPVLNPALSVARNLGQAATMQFPSIPAADYVNVAGWIRENVPYSQLLLQYTAGTAAAGLVPSISVALGSATNIPVVGTTLNGAVVSSFLSNLI